jgi:hypothetical protein
MLIGEKNLRWRIYRELFYRAHIQGTIILSAPDGFDPTARAPRFCDCANDRDATLLSWGTFWIPRKFDVPRIIDAFGSRVACINGVQHVEGAFEPRGRNVGGEEVPFEALPHRCVEIR